MNTAPDYGQQSCGSFIHPPHNRRLCCGFNAPEIRYSLEWEAWANNKGTAFRYMASAELLDCSVGSLTEASSFICGEFRKMKHIAEWSSSIDHKLQVQTAVRLSLAICNSRH
jgi:hypothetical protein